MTINTQYDPLKISEITNRKLDAKNRRTIPEVSIPTSNGQSSRAFNHSNRNSNHTKSDQDFLGMLLQADQTRSPSDMQFHLDEKKELNSLTGTNHFFSPQKKCEEKNLQAANNKFSFCIANTLAGEVNVQGEFDGHKCIVYLSLKSKLSTQEQAALEKILRSGLSKNLGVELEIKID